MRRLLRCSGVPAGHLCLMPTLPGPCTLRSPQVRQHAKELWQSQHAAQTMRAALARRDHRKPQDGAAAKKEGPQPKAGAAAAPQAKS